MADRNYIRMNSTGTNQKGKKTGYFLTTQKSKNKKLKKKCYDPRAFDPKTGKCGMHVVFEEGKIK